MTAIAAAINWVLHTLSITGEVLGLILLVLLMVLAVAGVETARHYATADDDDGWQKLRAGVMAVALGLGVLIYLVLTVGWAVGHE